MYTSLSATIVGDIYEFVVLTLVWQFYFNPCERLTMNVNKVLFDDRIKPKNVLALNEKVAAIRRYEVDPVYKKVGRMFNCSPDQIKRIIKQKNEILAEWENRTRKPATPTSHEIKTVRISVLGKAVHEWIRRIMYYTDFNLNDTLIQTMSLEFSKALKLQKFYPTKDWIANFRATYNLPDANTKTMSIGYQESQSVQIRDILRYVKEVCETKTVIVVDDESNSEACTSASVETADKEMEEIKIETEDSQFHGDIVVKVEQRECQPSSSATLQNPLVSQQSTNSDMSMQIDTETTNCQPVQKQSQETPTSDEQIQIKEEKVEPESEPEFDLDLELEFKMEPSPEPQPEPESEKIAIYSQEGAIACVKLLEDFALLKENFRLIGLIERLEEALNDSTEKKS